MKQRPFPLLAVVTVTFVIMFGFGLIVPTLPLFAASLGVKETGVGLLLTIFSGMRLVTSFFTASAIQRFGERTIAAAGAAIVGISSLSAGFAGSFPMLVLLRGFGGVGSAFFIGALMSSLLGGVDASQRGRAMASFQGSVVAGFIVGPAIGGLLGRISLRAPLYIYGAICLLATPVLYAVLRRAKAGSVPLADPALTIPGAEDNVPPPTVHGMRGVKPLLADSAYRGALAMAFAAFFVTGGIDALISLVWHFDLGQSKASVGIPFMVMGLASILPTMHAGRLADRRGRKFSTIPALFVTIPLILLLGYISTKGAFLVALAVLGAAWAYQRPGPSAIVGDVTDDYTRPVAIGALRIANDVGGLAGPILVGFVAEHAGKGAGFGVATLGVVFALFFMLPARETHGAKAQAA